MSLKKQIVIFILGLMLVLLLGTYLLSLANTKKFLEEALVNHAQDTATSLGLSLSTVANPSDEATFETMINAVFDRGYYLKMALLDQQGRLRYQRETPNRVEGVPPWFIQMISIQSPPAESVVQSGWTPIGTLVVQSHPGYAYVKLWHESLSLLAWFSLMAVMVVGVVFYALKRLLQPLLDVEKQARAIVRKEYIVQEALPETTELKRVVLAMNSMVEKMRELFERDAQQIQRLQKQAYSDAVTNFSNRLHFEMRFEAWMDPEEKTSHGMACLLRLQNLKALNAHDGYLVGDKYLMGLAHLWQGCFEKQGLEEGFYARLNGSEMIALLPQAQVEVVSLALRDFLREVSALRDSLKISEEEGALAVGATHYETGIKRSELMMRLDQSVQQAQKQVPSEAFFILEAQLEKSLLTQWQVRIEHALNKHAFKLYRQAAYDRAHQTFVTELLIRWQDQEVLRSAGYFMPMVERLGWTERVERFVLEGLLSHLKTSSLKGVYAVNISYETIQEPERLSWFFEALVEMGETFAQQVAFEIDEAAVHASVASVSDFIVMVRRTLPIKIGIDHVGSGFRDQFYFMSLMPDYLKLDGGFAKNILTEERTQLYVSAVAELASRLDIACVAMSVESEDQAFAFNGYGVAYCQGYVFGPPEPLS